MKPGRELDALVAEKVMRLVRDEHFSLWIPHYSRSIEAAWVVVDQMLQDGHIFQLIKWGSDWQADFAPESEMSEESPMHAICLAALKSVGHEFI